MIMGISNESFPFKLLDESYTAISDFYRTTLFVLRFPAFAHQT